MAELCRPHICAQDGLGLPCRHGVIARCRCGKLWRSVCPGNPDYAHWRRVGPLYRLASGKRLKEALES